MRFELTFFYEEGMDDVKAKLSVESDNEDQKLAVAIAHTLYSLNSGNFLEHLKALITNHAKETGDTTLAHLIFNEWQKMVLHNDTKPEVSASEAARINQAY
jgi:glutamate synthase domain-containing protein 3